MRRPCGRWPAIAAATMFAGGLGCGPEHVIVLQHPKTEDTVVCPPYEQTQHGDFSGKEACARGWAAKGYERLSEPRHGSFTW